MAEDKCNMSAEPSFADIRVEDGWQLSQYLTNEDYKLGASQVTVMSAKGEKLWQEAIKYVESVDVGIEHALHGCHKPNNKEYLNELVKNPELDIESIIRLYSKTIPIHKRIFDNLCNALFEVPSVYFFAKRIYRGIKRVDKKL